MAPKKENLNKNAWLFGVAWLWRDASAMVVVRVNYPPLPISTPQGIIMPTDDIIHIGGGADSTHMEAGGPEETFSPRAGRK